MAFYADEVFKADGEVYMYATYDDPKERATIVGFDKRSIVLPIRGQGYWRNCKHRGVKQ